MPEETNAAQTEKGADKKTTDKKKPAKKTSSGGRGVTKK